MRVKLAYGRAGLEVEVPDHAHVIAPRFVPVLPDEKTAITTALRQPIGSPPLAALVKPGDRVVVVHTDITRATPNARLLPVILEELELAGVRSREIVLMNGLGTHRRQTLAELRQMLGDALVDHYRCEQHNCLDEVNLVHLGVTRQGHAVRINRTYLEADVRILTGFIEPHFFAGFSGGPKAVLPSLAGTESVFSNHGLAMIADPRATWGVTAGNPIWEEMREVALMTRPAFLVNVTLNDRHEITGVFAGEMLAAHAEGCRFVAASAMAPVDEPFDIVVTTNSGYPLDQNLYQTVKGMSAAAQVVRPGGAIIMAAACADGIPDHGRYAELLARGGSPEGVLRLISQPGFEAQDQWQVQIQAQVQMKAEVYVYSDGLADAQIRAALLSPTRDIAATVRDLSDRGAGRASVCLLPQGPQTIPYLRSPAQRGF